MHVIRPTLRDSSALSSLPRLRARDGMMTFDMRAVDSAGAFLIGELERLDQKLHQPLVSITWSRDMPLREDVTIADEVSSFTNSTFAAPGGVVPNGKNWIAKETNTVAGIGLDIGKTAHPLNLWGLELGWTIPELESAIRLGRPVDQQKFLAMQKKHQMDIDEQVYIGDVTLPNCYGLLTNPAVSTTNVVNGAGGTPTWGSKTAAEILKDVNTVLQAAYAAAGWQVAPTELRIPPAQYGYLLSQTVSTAGNISILEFLQQNNLSNGVMGVPLSIKPLKWLVGRGTGGTDRMLAYTKDEEYVRFPMTPIQRTPLEYRQLSQLTTYFCRLGQVEFVYPETCAYADGI